VTEAHDCGEEENGCSQAKEAAYQRRLKRTLRMGEKMTAQKFADMATAVMAAIFAQRRALRPATGA